MVMAFAMLVSGCSALPDSSSAERELDKVIAGRVAGPPERCIEISRVNGPQIIDDQTIVYRQSGRRIWVNRLPDACPGLRTDALVVVQPTGSQLCSTDNFRTLIRYTSIPGAICRFGEFVPYEKPRR